MQKAIDETSRRRAIQQAYNEEHGITPTTIIKNREAVLGQTSVADKKKGGKKYYADETQTSLAADPVVAYMSKDQLIKLEKETRRRMEQAAKDLDFMEAARLRDEMLEVQKMLGEK